MTAKIFIDTNILVYALDQYDPEKQHKSREILFSVKWPKGPEASFPPRSCRKFYVTATKKLEVDALIVKDILHLIL